MAVLVVLLLGLTVPSLLHARREQRDGIRRDELAGLKRELEKKNNELGYYPIEFDASPHRYVVTEAHGDKAIAWYLRAELENFADSTSGFDEERDRNYYYRISNEDEKTFYDVCGGTLTCGV